MANEATLRISLNIRKRSTNTAQTLQMDYRSNPTGFQADVAAVGGPSPGEFLAALAGTDLDLTALTNPSLMWVMNMDDTNSVHYGPCDHSTGRFYPVFKLLPGEYFVHRLSEFLGQEEGTVTGTASVDSGDTLRFKGVGGACKIRVDCFEA